MQLDSVHAIPSGATDDQGRQDPTEREERDDIADLRAPARIWGGTYRSVIPAAADEGVLLRDLREWERRPGSLQGWKRIPDAPLHAASGQREREVHSKVLTFRRCRDVCRV